MKPFLILWLLFVAFLMFAPVEFWPPFLEPLYPVGDWAAESEGLSFVVMVIAVIIAVMLWPDKKKAVKAEPVQHVNVSILELRDPIIVIQTLLEHLNSIDAAVGQIEKLQNNPAVVAQARAIRERQQNLEARLAALAGSEPSILVLYQEMSSADERLSRQLEDIDSVGSHSGLTDDIQGWERTADDQEKRVRKIEPLAARLASLKQRFDTLGQTLEPLEDEEKGIEAVYGEITDLEKEVDEALDNLEGSSGDNDNFEEDVDDLEKSIEDFEKRMRDLQKQFSRMREVGSKMAGVLALPSNGAAPAEPV